MMNQIFHKKRQKLFTLFCQAVIVVGSFIMANAIRYDGVLPAEQLSVVNALLLPLVLIKLSSFIVTRLLSSWWRYVSIHDLVALVKANLLGSLLFLGYLNYFSEVTVLPSILFIDGLLCFLIMSGARVAIRLVREYSLAANRAIKNGTEKILIVGSGATGQSIARDISQNPHQKRRVVGFVDQDIDRIRQRFEGIPVLSSVDGMDELLQSQPIDLVILANPTLCHKELRKIVMTCQSRGVKSKILPNIDEILNGDVSIRHLRDIKFSDLLGRPPVHLDVKNIRNYLGGKRVMVTGAAGSIGQEICQQAAEFGASSLILFDNAETPLFNIERNLRKAFPNTVIIPSLSDVRDFHQVNHVFQSYRPEVVFHAAAYKHVPMSEKNPIAAIENNVLGTSILVNAAHNFKVDHFVMVSTDKAVNPTNIMGASKRAAEIYAQALSRQSETSIVTVRFGNVLGSNGSVVPIFREQIEKGGPVTVTDPETTRFFMTIPEAVQLVLQAGSMGQGGEIFILNMGEQVKILHLAEELIRLSGMIPYEDIDIVFSGLRPGEKLHEELLLGSEGVIPTDHEKICVANSVSKNLDELDQWLAHLTEACHSMNERSVVNILKTLVPEYHQERNGRKVSPGSTRLIKPKVLEIPVNVAKLA